MGKKEENEFPDEEIARHRDDVIRRMANTPPKPHSEMKVGKAKTSSKASRPAPDGTMIVYDVQSLPNGEVVIGKPYRRLPDGRVASLIAS